MEWLIERSGNVEVIGLKPRFESPPDSWSVGIAIAQVGGQAVVQQILADSAGEAAGLRQGDILVRADNKVIDVSSDPVASIQASQGSPMEWLIVRDGLEQLLNVKPDPNADSSSRRWRVGVRTRLVDPRIVQP